MRIETEILRKVPQLPPQGTRVVQYVLAVERDLSRSRFEQAGQNPHECRFSPPLGPKSPNMPFGKSRLIPCKAATGPG